VSECTCAKETEKRQTLLGKKYTIWKRKKIGNWYTKHLCGKNGRATRVTTSCASRGPIATVELELRVDAVVIVVAPSRVIPMKRHIEYPLIAASTTSQMSYANAQGLLLVRALVHVHLSATVIFYEHAFLRSVASTPRRNRFPNWHVVFRVFLGKTN